MEVSGHITPQALYPQGRDPSTHCTQSVDGASEPVSMLRRGEKYLIPIPQLPGMQPCH